MNKPEQPICAAEADPFAGQPVERIERDGVHFTLLGTAHVSRKSAETVSAALAGGEFDAVAVPLRNGVLIGHRLALGRAR